MEKPYCDVCDKYFANVYNLKRHQTTLAHQNIDQLKSKKKSQIINKPQSPKKIFITNNEKKNIIKRNETINIFMPIHGVNTKIFSYTLKDDDDHTVIDELQEAMKPMFQMIALMKEMEKNPNIDKKTHQIKIEDLKKQLSRNLINTPLISKLMFLEQTGTLNRFLNGKKYISNDDLDILNSKRIRYK